MCGRFVMSTSADDLMAEFRASGIETEELAADYNVAPTKDVYAVLERPPRGEHPPVRQLRGMRWGLVPSWADDPSGGARLINARVETVAEKPAFRQAFAVRRCLIPADGYYEWYGDRRRGRRQPYFLHPGDDGLLAMAGVYELWRDRSRPRDDPGSWLWTVAVITGEARGPLAELHDRMPLAVGRDHYDAWLDPGTTDAEQVRGLLASPHERLTARPVSTAVNDVRSRGPDLIAPTPAAPVDLTLF